MASHIRWRMDIAEQFDKWGGLDAIYSSSLLRTLQTTKPTYDKLQAPWHVWPSLCETGRRRWPLLRQLQNEGSYESYLEEDADARIAVMCHGAFGSVFINALLGGEPCDHIRFHQAHAAISLLEVMEDSTASIHFLNHVNHMPLNKITEGWR